MRGTFAESCRFARARYPPSLPTCPQVAPKEVELPDELFGQLRKATPERYYLTLAAVADIFKAAGVPMRNASAPRASHINLTSARFGLEPAGRAEQLAVVEDYVDTSFQRKIGKRVGLALTFAQSGAGKSFLLQAIDANLSSAGKVVVPMTFNYFSSPRLGETTPGAAGAALGLRAAFAFFADFADEDTVRKQWSDIDRALTNDDALTRRAPDLKLVIEAIDYVVGQDKQLVLLVDEVAATKQIEGVVRVLSDAADYLVAQGRSVAVVITGLGMREWEMAGISWNETASRRPLTWIVLQPAVDEESEGRLEVEFRKAVLQWKKYQGMDENRTINLVRSVIWYANGHWRTLEQMRDALDTMPPDRFDVNEVVLAETEVLAHAHRAAQTYWEQRRNRGTGRQLEMAFFLACAALRLPLTPADTMPVPGGSSIAFHRFDCSELGGVDGVPEAAKDFVPNFAVPHIRTWASATLENSAKHHPSVVELARLHSGLIDLATRATPAAFEIVVAMHERLRLVAHDVMEGMRWQLRQSQRAPDASTFERWPTEDELPSVGSRGRLWKFADGSFPDKVSAIELVDYFDATVTCSRELVAGDVILPARDNPAWDVMVLVACDGGKVGLRLVECKFGAKNATNPVLRKKDVRDKVQLLIDVYTGVLFNSSGSNATARWSKLSELVHADDVEVEFVVNGQWQKGIEEEIKRLSTDFGVFVSIKEAPLRMSAVFERLALLLMRYMSQ